MLASLRPALTRPLLLTPYAHQIQYQVRVKSSMGQLAKKTKTLSVILTQNIPGIGEEGEELTVKRGYARNYLFPKGYAVYATPEAKRAYADAAAKIDYVERARRKALESAQKRLRKLTLKVKRQRIDEDRLYAPVDARTISDQLWKQFHIDIDPERIILPEEGGLDSWGMHTVKIKVDDQGTADLAVQVMMR